METFKPQPNPDNVSKSESDLESVENLSVPQRVEKLIKEKYNFKSLADFENLSNEQRAELFKDCFLNPVSTSYENREDGTNFSIDSWQQYCYFIGLEERKIFPQSGLDSYGPEYINIISPYQDIKKEIRRQEELKTWRLDEPIENRKTTNQYVFQEDLFRKMLDGFRKESDFKEYKDWFSWDLNKKREFMKSLGYEVEYDDLVKPGHIRYGYKLINRDEYGQGGVSGAFKRLIVDRSKRSDKESLLAESAIYDNLFITNFNYRISIMHNFSDSLG